MCLRFEMFHSKFLTFFFKKKRNFGTSEICVYFETTNPEGTTLFILQLYILCHLLYGGNL